MATLPFLVNRSQRAGVFPKEQYVMNVQRRVTRLVPLEFATSALQEH
jgi:hypothetical protein